MSAAISARRGRSNGSGFANATVLNTTSNAVAIKAFIGLASLLYARGNHRNRTPFPRRLSYRRECHRPLNPAALTQVKNPRRYALLEAGLHTDMLVPPVGIAILAFAARPRIS